MELKLKLEIKLFVSQMMVSESNQSHISKPGGLDNPYYNALKG